MFDIVETLESYKIDLAEEGIRDSLSGVGNKLKENKIIGAVIKFIQDRIDGLKKRFQGLVNLIKNNRFALAHEESVADKAALKYVDMSIKGVKLISGSVKAVSGIFKSGKQESFEKNANKYMEKVTDYKSSMADMWNNIRTANRKNVFSANRAKKLTSAIDSGIKTLTELKSTVEGTLKAAMTKKRSYNEASSSATFNKYVSYVKSSVDGVVTFLNNSKTIVLLGAKAGKSKKNDA